MGKPANFLADIPTASIRMPETFPPEMFRPTPPLQCPFLPPRTLEDQSEHLRRTRTPPWASTRGFPGAPHQRIPQSVETSGTPAVDGSLPPGSTGRFPPGRRAPTASRNEIDKKTGKPIEDEIPKQIGSTSSMAALPLEGSSAFKNRII
jgi:hypothetical protein